MLKNYFKAAIRSLVTNKVYSLINIGGLAVSLAASVLLLLWVRDELSYNGFHKNSDRMYMTATQVNANGDKNTFSVVPGPLASFGKKEVPGIEAFCRVSGNNNVSLFQYKEKSFIEDKCSFADPSFFTMFNFPLVEGNPQKPFTDDNSIVISQTTAKKYFGNDDPIGKVIKTDGKTNYAVSGVMKDIPKNSSIQCDFVFPMDILKDQITSNWGGYGYRTFFLLQPGTDATATGQKLADMLRHYSNIDFTKSLKFILQPIDKIHLYKPTGEENGMQIVRIFFIVACIILLIACINYVNLVTARATKRAKEIGVRKLIGAGKWQLFRQFMGESLTVFVIALVLSIVLIYLVMPVYNSLAGKEMVFVLTSPEVLSVFGVTMLATLLLAGIYPALMLSSFKPMESMKGKLGRMGKKGGFRKVLVVVQFSFSIILITSTIIIGRQLKYERDVDLGYDKENIITVNMRQEMSTHYDAIKASLLKQPGIQAVTASRQNIMNVGGGTADLDWDGKRPDQKSFLITICSIERDFIPTMHLQLLQGKGFSGTPADSASYLFNETAIEQMGIKNPIGKSFTFRYQKGIIAGVVKDFHIANMHSKIDPLIMYFDPMDRHVLYVKTTGRDASAAVTALEDMWKQYSPSYPFKYAFMDDSFADTYKGDQQVGKLFNCFAIITILISCLGLLGLVTYTAETKVKEIGIRKTLGASVGSIVALLTKDFIKPVIIAAVIALPVAYWAMDMWLQNFAYRTTISWWVFVLAAVGAIAIALATISYQSIKAALMSPVKAIKME